MVELTYVLSSRHQADGTSSPPSCSFLFAISRSNSWNSSCCRAVHPRRRFIFNQSFRLTFRDLEDWLPAVSRHGPLAPMSRTGDYRNAIDRVDPKWRWGGLSSLVGRGGIQVSIGVFFALACLPVVPASNLFFLPFSHTFPRSYDSGIRVRLVSIDIVRRLIPCSSPRSYSTTSVLLHTLRHDLSDDEGYQSR
ncbi:hypothetical protein BC834DRAFT_288205 [Gloeopeniophorella convolvens]|nr:hypothetical protein BC834DRAFT_288205 [Gloeopeniophorella convolvens]